MIRSLIAVVMSSLVSLSTVVAEDQFFDIPFKEVTESKENLFAGYFPSEILKITGNPSKAELRLFLSENQFKVESDTVGGLFVSFPSENLFKSASFRFESGHLSAVELGFSGDPPPRERIEGFYQSLTQSIGNAKWEIWSKMLERSEDRSLNLLWKNSGYFVIYRISSPAPAYVSMSLTYFSMSGRSVATRMSKATDSEKLIDAEVRFTKFLNGIKELHPGYKPKPFVFADSENGMFEQLYKASTVKKNAVSARKQQLIQRLDSYYSKLTQSNRFKHVYGVATDEDYSFLARLGAATYLSLEEDAKSLQFLFEHLKPTNPPDIAGILAQGISKFCEGKTMDRVLEMYGGDEKMEVHYAAVILSNMDTPEQLGELIEKVRRINDPEMADRLPWLVRDIRENISQKE